MAELLAALLLAVCLLPPACHGRVTADQLLAASERMGQEQRALNYPMGDQEEDGRG